jgi:hypothetical protein
VLARELVIGEIPEPLYIEQAEIQEMMMGITLGRK